ncbi:hypothetical protein CN918_32195 [Priestia megaterium]|nr:hypothetical protein CN918_32195 [Priestia megaterium]
MKKALWVIITLVISFAVICVSAWYTFKRVNHASAGTATIFKGASSKEIADILEGEGIIEDSDFFYYYIKGKIWYEKNIKKNFKEKNYAFKEGDYKFKNGNFDSIIRLLVKGENNPQTINVTFPEGITILDIAKILEEHKIIKQQEFLAYVRTPANYLQFKNKYKWLPVLKPGIKELFEGYLHTSTYAFPKNKSFETDANLIVDMMLKETNRWYEDNLKTIENQPYAFSQLLTLASVIEKEAKFNKDRSRISQVFYNRIYKGMKLQSDMTAAYANGEHKVFLYYKDIQVKSPYNTYYIKGLPIGPIAAPSEDSFYAALKPKLDEQAYYFYARPNGETLFSVTAKQHQQNINLYQKEWKALEAQEKAKVSGK